MATKTRTLKDVVVEATSYEDKATIHDALSNWLRTYYVGRDSAPAAKKFSRDGATVAEATIEEVACELDEGAKELRRYATSLLGEPAP